MYTVLSPSTDAQELVSELRRIEEALLRAARAEQAARRTAQAARLALWIGGILGIVLCVVDVSLLIRSDAWPRLAAGAVLLLAAYALRRAWLRFRGAQAQLAETRAILARLHARLRALRAHRA
jgi:hypothetical protein